MRLLLNDGTTDDTLHVTTEIDEDSDIAIKYDNILVGWIFKSRGNFEAAIVNSDDREKLARKGVQFNNHLIFVG